MRIPCLSLWQPWATLMAIGAKRNETRSWAIKHRGLLAIHAAKKWSFELGWLVSTTPEFRRIFEPMVLADPDSYGVYTVRVLRRVLPFGAIVCVVRVLDCLPTTHTSAPAAGTDERAFGDYSPGRFFFRTELVHRFETPIPCVGRQGLFQVEVPL